MTSLQVIGAGLGRTGTMSLKEALEILGYGPCHHMTVALREQSDKIHLWKNLAKARDIDSLKILFNGFTSTTDYPGCLFYQEFMKLNPDAKVILTVRDNAESWAVSVRSTIFSTSNLATILRWVVSKLHINNLYYLQYIQTCAWRKHGVNALKEDTDLVKMYRDWEMSVCKDVPQDKLLVYNVKEGWIPLCNFLKVPVPDVAFPALNSTQTFKSQNSFGFIMRRSLTKLTLIGIVIAGIASLIQLTTVFK